MEAIESSKNDEVKVRLSWLRFMYAYTIVGAGGIGFALLFAPNAAMSLLGIPTQEPIMAGVAYSVWVAFGILSILGLQSPMKFVPVLLLQFAYKVVWFTAVIAPIAITGALPSFGFTMIAIFASYVIGDIIVIPWRYLLSK